MPRPRRLADGLLPSTGRNVFSRILGFLYLEQVGYFVDHAAVFRGIDHFNAVTDTAQTQTKHTGPVRFQSTAGAFKQNHSYFLISHALLQDLFNLFTTLGGNRFRRTH